MTRIVIRQFANKQKRMVSVLAMILTCSVLASTAQATYCGDADGNGQITVTDGVNVLRAAAGLSGNCPVARCDVDGNGNVTVTDGVNVLRAAAGLSVILPCAPQGRFVDNGDGTVTDNQTGLMWEKKTTAVGSGVNFADPHDVDNEYDWIVVNEETVYAITEFLLQLNTPPCFAGHCDWRLPTCGGYPDEYKSGYPAELETLLLGPFPCLGVYDGESHCIAKIFGPTIADAYWTAPPDGSWDSYGGWFVDFLNGDVEGDDPDQVEAARAVRTAS